MPQSPPVPSALDAARALDRGDLAVAEAGARGVLHRNPADALALHVLGLVSAAQNKPAERAAR